MITANGLRTVTELGLYVTLTWVGKGQVEVHVEVANGNTAPVLPPAPTGPISGKIGKVYTYTGVTTDPETNDLNYRWVWAEGDTSAWLGPYTSGNECKPTHTWQAEGTYNVKVCARDVFGKTTDWSNALTVTMYNYACGDANNDPQHRVNVADATFIINYVFVPGSPPPVPVDRGNVNCDTKTNVADATYIINFVFVPGSPTPCQNCPK